MDKITDTSGIYIVYYYLQLHHSLIHNVPFSQVHKAQNVASKRGKLLTEDFLYLIRKVHFPNSTFDYLAYLQCSSHVIAGF
jgi:hypothetical protein